MEKNYASLAVNVGVNLQKGQILVIQSPIECADFARSVAKAAYERGAKDVVILWNDELFAKLRFEKADISVFGEFPAWRKDCFESYAEKGAAFINIAASDPEIMRGVDKNKLSLFKKTAGGALVNYRERLMSNKNRWCIISRPTRSWAKKVFPDLDDEAAFAALEKAIYKATRADAGDAAENWAKHTKELAKRAKFLNEQNFKCLRYKNSLGTDLTVELAENHIWAGGAEIAADGVEFVANMPTEEVYTMPKREGTNGVVFATRPLQYQGNLIENFTLTFKDGKVVDFSAKKNETLLKELLNTDEGASFLGEVALVPFDSPINNSGVLFYNTLFDENASSHLALGKAYPTCIKDGESMDSVTLVKNGANDSILHEDFMIGSKDLSVVGVTQDNRETQVMIDGNFAF
ncbi:MAG: aminopeptidase [Selenomonadaceae bacterium]|nr:aminopeptidase [Selenomonadaceae bacterium]